MIQITVTKSFSLISRQS